MTNFSSSRLARSRAGNFLFISTSIPRCAAKGVNSSHSSFLRTETLHGRSLCCSMLSRKALGNSVVHVDGSAKTVPKISPESCSVQRYAYGKNGRSLPSTVRNNSRSRRSPDLLHRTDPSRTSTPSRRSLGKPRPRRRDFSKRAGSNEGYSQFYPFKRHYGRTMSRLIFAIPPNYICIKLFYLCGSSSQVSRPLKRRTSLAHVLLYGEGGGSNPSDLVSALNASGFYQEAGNLWANIWRALSFAKKPRRSLQPKD